MEKMKVGDLMVPVAEFPKISRDATYYEALQALEEAQRQYSSGESKQRILLLEDEKGRVVGKISPIDMLLGLEPRYSQIDMEDNLTLSGVKYYLKNMEKEARLWQPPFADLCHKAKDVHVKDFMRTSPDKQAVQKEDWLVKAFDWFVMGRNDSLFVYDGDVIVGLLKFSDVYRKLQETIRQCGL